MQQTKNFNTSPKHFDPSPKSYECSPSMSGSTNNPKHNNSKFEVGKQSGNQEVKTFEGHMATNPLNDAPQKISFSEDGFELEDEHILEGDCSEDESDDHLILPNEIANVQSIDQLIISDQFPNDELNNQVISTRKSLPNPI